MCCVAHSVSFSVGPGEKGWPGLLNHVDSISWHIRRTEAKSLDGHWCIVYSGAIRLQGHRTHLDLFSDRGVLIIISIGGRATTIHVKTLLPIKCLGIACWDIENKYFIFFCIRT